MNTQDVGKLIKNKRKEKNMNQKQLAELLHVSHTTVSKWETGVNFPDIQNLKEISSVLDIALLELLDETPLVPGSDSAPDNLDPPANVDPTTPESPVPEPQVDPSEPEISPFSQPSGGKRKWFKVGLPLLIILFITIGALFWYVRIKSKVFSYTICNEYYDDYNGKSAYYIVLEFKGELTDDILLECAIEFKEEYMSFFSKVDLIIIVYVEDYDTYEKKGFNDATDGLNFLYPPIELEDVI